MIPATKYWMVHRVGTACHVQHPTRALAEAEAKRLSEQAPGHTFNVLEVVSSEARDEGSIEMLAYQVAYHHGPSKSLAMEKAITGILNHLERSGVKVLDITPPIPF